MTDLVSIDAQARERALDIGQSFIVQAPAGSGKTTVLTQRYLKLLAAVDQPEQVLAITFTRKAAGEMRERVQKALSGDIPVNSPADALTMELANAVRAHAARRGWGIEDSAARLRIQTIDAFNGYLANSLPITSQSGFGRAIADSPADLYALAARETMRDAEEDPDRRRDLERILRRLDDNWGRLEKLIAGMLPRRAEWLPNLPQLSGEALVPRVEASLEAIVAEELANAAGEFSADFVLQASELARFASLNIDIAAKPALLCWRDAPAALRASLDDLPRWRCIAALALTGEGTLRKTLTKNDGIPAGDARGKIHKEHWLERLRLMDQPQVDALQVLRMLPDPRIPADAREALASLSRLLLQAATMLRALFDQHGECDHTEIAGAARQALTQDSSPTPLAERIGTHLQHILIDEFQDTSRDQYELLRTLTRDWSAGDGRTLFLVGDPMQSIYGFRNAEVGRFATVRAAGLAGIKLESLTLRRNFRSAPTLVEWCNRAFAQVFPLKDDVRRSAVPHLASVAGSTQLEGETQLYRVAIDGAGGARAEAECVAAQIATLRATRPDETIAVLAGARPHLRAVRASLNSARIPFIGVNLEPLANVAVVRDLEALVRALESPLDRVAWLAVLRAPFIGLSLPDLTVVSDVAGEGTIASALSTNFPGLTPDGAQRLIRARPALLGAWHQRERESRAHLVERTWLALGGSSACAQASELTQARRFLAALDEEDRKRLRGRPLDLGALMDKLYATDPGQPGAVSLMTIHGAKGLEFHHVFVVGVGRRGRGDDPRLLNWLELPREDGPDHLLMAPIRYRGEDDAEADAINAYVGLLHKERARAERTRLAYVALTRAKLSLHLFVHPVVQITKDGERILRAGTNTLLDNLWPAIGAEIEAFTTVGDTQAIEIAPATPQTRQRLPAKFAAPVAPVDVLARGELVPLGAEDDAIEFSWARQTARRVGTVVHEALERFGRANLPSLAELPQLRPRLVSRLEALGVEPERAREGADVALRALAGTLSDERGRWLFDPAHAQASSELALSGVRGGHIVNAVIDRTFVDAEGIRWVVDFKTSPHEGGDLQTFLDEEVKRYEAQLQRYAHLARGLGPQAVRAGLYYPLLSAWREVPLSGRG